MPSDVSHIINITVANLYCSSIKNLVQLVGLWEPFVNWLRKDLAIFVLTFSRYCSASVSLFLSGLMIILVGLRRSVFYW